MSAQYLQNIHTNGHHINHKQASHPSLDCIRPTLNPQPPHALTFLYSPLDLSTFRTIHTTVRDRRHTPELRRNS
ncbi:hypothetical protein HanRHA438_Chr06g0263801 [Helianthus annuus]|uniref:Uncharacterized protein n=1 Tax=Helianthus annuus TaxID=4232 RepID=A0A9K3ISD8_HELAN|nr:hypothetical protein HanXRQr2_Chr06g0254441 [Helianthus annuus]KAF5801987.1 hypothetical protein HanXRQr2_Chr06g0254451 [Helianthus annuus]KAJ0560213.1 hypothetical protein HanHA300_Chr06g0208981 [Helianthus annuus]KAJ0573214.1 hypothetical protein HanHA89_Chr06g0224311 [Helianthus annuus]KAJ0737632.1 hypothetical protein HanLR1_Chr06g0209161 [Helianthus annuus]